MSIQSGLVVFHTDLSAHLVDIDSVRQHPSNYNNGDVDEIIRSIEVNGMYRPIYAQRSTGYIVAGNHTWEACKHLEAQQIPVIFLDLDDTQAKRLMLADNRIASLAQPDTAQLLALLDELEIDGGIEGTGFSETDREVLRALAEQPLNYDEVTTWPLLTFRVHPTTKAAFEHLTQHAGDDTARFTHLMTLAGWDGKAPRSIKS